MATLQSLPLHPWHTRAGEAIPSALPVPRAADVSRPRALLTFAGDSARSLTPAEASAPATAWIARVNENLEIWSTLHEDDIAEEAQLVLSEAQPAVHGDWAVVAISALPAEDSEDPNLYAWLLALPASNVAECMDLLGSCGVIRWDLLSTYDLSVQAFNSGGTAKVHIAKRRGLKAGDEKATLAAKISNEVKSIVPEIVHLLAVQGHPNVVCFHGAFRMTDDFEQPVPLWVVLIGFHARGDLHTDIAIGGAYDARQCIGLAHGLLNALDFTHRRGIVHRDVKAENVLIADDGSPVLCDYGLAAELGDEEELLRRCGSPGYVAPEIIKGRPYDEKVDIFAAGIAIYFGGSGGSLPFNKVGMAVQAVLKSTVKEPISFAASRWGLVPHGLKMLIEALVAKRPQERPSAEEAMELAAELVPPATPPEEPEGERVAAPSALVLPGVRMRHTGTVEVSPPLVPTDDRVLTRNALLSDDDFDAPNEPESMPERKEKRKDTFSSFNSVTSSKGKESKDKYSSFNSVTSLKRKDKYISFSSSTSSNASPSRWRSSRRSITSNHSERRTLYTLGEDRGNNAAKGIFSRANMLDEGASYVGAMLKDGGSQHPSLDRLPDQGTFDELGHDFPEQLDESDPVSSEPKVKDDIFSLLGVGEMEVEMEVESSTQPERSIAGHGFRAAHALRADTADRASCRAAS